MARVRERLGFRHEDVDPRLNVLASALVDSAGEVRRELGSGLVESVYLECLAEELRSRGHEVGLEVALPVVYKGRTLEKRFRVDLLLGQRIVVEVKAGRPCSPSTWRRRWTNLRLSGAPLGFFINFHAVPFVDGIRRFANTRR